ncbi:circularly permuted type 2 ATP-grasp protein [Rhizobiales bacterium]|uniref:circularly permuted type 2 ATP-grasp protein n=1 Tax=Hongsoonwoonella zoysiae TaxID=2821844 RepID=UPI00155F600F|nr:circularly permuted type 2 ATP-grasp protein [Hongsoonwoonella zoysiae]NRG18185.1 circularly permuted type 2 ATP-grasp protein [Hongsoonwoonella zoysiae]
MTLDQATGERTSASSLLGAYHSLAGVPDELLDAKGAVRPVWQPFLGHLSRMASDDISRRFARGDQYLRDAGVFFRHYGEKGTSEREWPLSHIPVVIDAKEWRQIAAGLIQRAELLEDVVADLYGPNRLVAEGYLPACMIGKSPEWLRPLVGVTPRSGKFLHFLAFEIGRGPDGTWWVLGDRTQAPSGAGFALENRVATSRVFNEFFARANVQRLAGFFRRFRDQLMALRGETESRVAILTPGLMNDTYFEHAYIARYLGFMLLEGEDLTVENGKLMVRTVAGLKPASVLWRRLDAVWSDPLELNETSRIGTPGLVEAVRRGSVTMINALGAGILETRALLAFLPLICKGLRGEPLILPNIATWWCGEERVRQYVAQNAGRMLISRALSTDLPFAASGEDVRAGDFICPEGGTLGDWLNSRGEELVGQEAVTLSTTPAYIDGALVPRPMSLRVFLARTADGWEVMSGGFARIGKSQDASALAMQAGGTAADVWVIGGEPTSAETLLQQPGTPYLRSQPGILPSRAADNLFWLGRYVERAEGAIRQLRAYHARLSETDDPASPLVSAIGRFLQSSNVDPAEAIPGGLRTILNSAVFSASKVRDRFSVDGWLALNDLAQTAERMQETIIPGDDAAQAMGVLLRKITGFSGLVHENMYRFTGWRFLGIGRSLERANATARLLAVFTDPSAPEGALELALEVGDSAMSMNRRYAVAISSAAVLDLLALDTKNPRSILYQLNEMQEHLSVLPGAHVHGQLSKLSRQMLQVQTSLAISTPETLTPGALQALSDEIASLSVGLNEAYTR